MLRVGLARVRGRSMLPTLRDGDLLLVAYGVRPRIGRLALVTLPPDDSGQARPISVKRVTGRDPDGGQGWWVERDNPTEGIDSWQVGALPSDAVLAAVVTRLPRWPRPN